MPVSLETLLQHPALWRASGQAAAARSANRLSSGCDQVDAHLPGGGWPFPGLIELFTRYCGLGEIGLLLPALRQLQSPSPERVIAWLNPPFIPYAPALVQQGLDLERQIISGPLTATQTLWAMEQALRSGACGAVLAWADHARAQDLRRLKLACSAGRSLGVLFRSPRHRLQPSPANLRMLLSSDATELHVQFLKVQRGRPGRLSLPLPQQ